MPGHCCVPGCNSNYKSYLESGQPPISVFRFPRDENLMKQWLKSIPRASFTPSRCAVVCAKHFPEDAIVRTDIYRLPDGTLTNIPAKTKLNSNAVPTIFSDLTYYLFKTRQTKAERELEASLYSMEILDRASPELWPENFPGMSEFTNKITQSKSIKLPYSRELTQDDQNYMHQLASLPTTELISRVKQLHDIAYQLGVEETKEITRGKYLNLFNKRRPKS
ncbi:hypothetical protein WA026_001262 [Henosepilachna vigintioctopunctata]|uniref:THAP-type domain-containing protein n=1 Tax=Henosepilachna vigintioctopunctata TaxID=420089 RepID=A0AAW1UJ40_9CUCU